jgi:hypothetical protein
MENRHLVQIALDHFASICSDPIKLQLAEAFGSNWRSYASLPDHLAAASDLDSHSLLFSITRNWRDAFAANYLPEVRDAATALLAGRNAWAHARTDLSDGVRIRAISAAEDLISVFGGADAAREFQRTISSATTEPTNRNSAIKPRLNTKAQKTPRGASTQPGYVNRNNQAVERKTDLAGNDHLQKVYILKCGECGHRYGSNGSDNFQRKCPSCQGGSRGLSFE